MIDLKGVGLASKKSICTLKREANSPLTELKPDIADKGAELMTSSSIRKDRRVREANVADAPRIAIIHLVSWQVAYRDLIPDHILARLSLQQRVAFWLQKVKGPRHLCQVIEENGRIIGWSDSGASRDSDALKRKVGEVYAIYLDPAAWRRGAGKELMEAACQALRQKGYPEMTVWVLEGNQRARRFYESMGFQLEQGIRKAVARHDNSLPEVRYRLRFEEEEL